MSVWQRDEAAKLVRQHLAWRKKREAVTHRHQLVSDGELSVRNALILFPSRFEITTHYVYRESKRNKRQSVEVREFWVRDYHPNDAGRADEVFESIARAKMHVEKKVIDEIRAATDAEWRIVRELIAIAEAGENEST